MKRYGYIRVSAKEQNPKRQLPDNPLRCSAISTILILKSAQCIIHIF